MARKKLLRVISHLWRHDSIWPRWRVRSLKTSRSKNVSYRSKHATSPF